MAGEIRMAAYQMHPWLTNKIIIFADNEEEDFKLELIQEMIDEDMYIWYINCNHFCNWLHNKMESYVNTPGEIRHWRFVIFSETSYNALSELLARNLAARKEEEPEDNDEAMEMQYLFYPQQIGYCGCGIHYTGVPDVEYEGGEGGLLD